MFIVMVIYGVFFPSELQRRPNSADSLGLGAEFLYDH